MKLTCHSCGAKYTVSDDKIQGKTVKMKCRKCGSTIVVGGAADAGAGADVGAADAGSPPAGSFLVNVADGDQRTMSLAEIVDAYRAGVVTDDTYVWADGMTDWQAIAEHADVSAAVRGGGGAPAPAAAEMDFGGGGGGGFGAAVPAAAASSGGFDAPRAAAKKEGKASRDLFGQDRPSTGGGLFGSSSTSSSASSGGGLMTSGGAVGTGKRDENSVLFSLSALTSNEPVAGAGKTTAKKDDSGLIDLKALSANAGSAPAAPPSSSDALGLGGLGMMGDSAAVFPLGMPIMAPPPAAAPVVDLGPPPAKSKLPLLVGGAVAIVAMVLVFFLVKGDPPPPPAPTPVVTAAPAPTQEPPPAPVATETAPEPSASASAVAAAPPKGKWPPPGKGTPKPGTAPGGAAPGGAAPGGAAPPPPAPKKSPCGCSPSDLMCNMKCSTKK
jgi:predicted Zn finger-like uncharacterized protein